MAKEQNSLQTLRAWFSLTGREKLFMAGILLILLIGLTARYVHLRTQQPDAYRPEGSHEPGAVKP